MNKIFTWTLGVCFGWVILVGFIGFIQHAQDTFVQPQASQQTKPPVTQDYYMTQLAAELGVDITYINLILADNPKVEGEQGSFAPPSTIYLDPTATKELQLRIFAHEYLHYIWENKMSSSEKESYRLGLIRDEEDFPELQERMEPYMVDKLDDTGTSNELHSIMCTEQFVTLTISDEMAKHCDQWIPNRSILFAQAQ